MGVQTGFNRFVKAVASRAVRSQEWGEGWGLKQTRQHETTTRGVRRQASPEIFNLKSSEMARNA